MWGFNLISGKRERTVFQPLLWKAHPVTRNQSRQIKAVDHCSELNQSVRYEQEFNFVVAFQSDMTVLLCSEHTLWIKESDMQC